MKMQWRHRPRMRAGEGSCWWSHAAHPQRPAAAQPPAAASPSPARAESHERRHHQHREHRRQKKDHLKLPVAARRLHYLADALLHAAEAHLRRIGVVAEVPQQQRLLLQLVLHCDADVLNPGGSVGLGLGLGWARRFGRRPGGGPEG